jgi:hypothetical protein
VRGCKIWAYPQHSEPLSREGSLSCHTCCDTGPRFCGLIQRTAPFSRLLRHSWGCRWSILTRALRGFIMGKKLVIVLLFAAIFVGVFILFFYTIFFSDNCLIKNLFLTATCTSKTLNFRLHIILSNELCM